jgi:hypothetical protein
MNVRIITALGATALAVGLIAGCATKPDTAASTTPTPTPASADYAANPGDLTTLSGYSDIAGDFKTLSDESAAIARRYDVDGLKSKGWDFVSLGTRGLDLPDIPAVGSAANEAWDDAMTDYKAAGSQMVAGAFDGATESLESAGANLRASTAAVATATEMLNNS